MSLTVVVKEIREHIKYFGLLSSLVMIFDSVINRIVPFKILHVVLLERKMVKKPVTDSKTQFSCRVTSIESFQEMLDSLLPHVVSKHQLDTYTQSAQDGDLLLLNYAGEELAGFTCAHLGGRPCLLPDLQIKVPESVVYNYSAFTFPKFRGRNLQGFRHYELLQQPPCQDKEGLIGYVLYNNFKSLRGVIKSGYRVLGKIWMIGTGEQKRTYLSRSVKKFGIELL